MAKEVIFTSKKNLESLILNSGGILFTAEFTKKDGSIRRLNGRTNVSRYIKGTGSQSSRVLTVWETPKPQEGQVDPALRYRSIRPESLRAVRIGGREFRAEL